MKYLRLVAALCPSAVILLALLAPGLPAPSSAAGAERVAARKAVLRRAETEAHTTVGPPAAVSAPGVQSASFSVTYDGLPNEARQAFEYAARIWQTQVTSTVPIAIGVGWREMPDGVLGTGGPHDWARAFPGAPREDTYYPSALANKLAGFDLAPAAFDIIIQLNSHQANWYFGTDGRPGEGQVDFVTVVLHEIGHGLGFLGSGQYDPLTATGRYGIGAGAQALPAVWDRYVVDGSGLPILNLASGTTLLGLFLTSNYLYFAGPGALQATGARPRIFAPSPFQPGQSYAHLDEETYLPGSEHSLMTPYLGKSEAIHDPGALARGILGDLGWSRPDPRPAATPSPAATVSPSLTPTTTPPPTEQPAPTATAHSPSDTVTPAPTVTVAPSSSVTSTPTAGQTVTATGTPVETITPVSSPTPTLAQRAFIPSRCGFIKAAGKSGPPAAKSPCPEEYL